MVAWLHVGSDVPIEIWDAMEIAIANVLAVEVAVTICPDVSGSMRMPATGYRRGGTSKLRCVDVASLIAAFASDRLGQDHWAGEIEKVRVSI